MEGNSWRPTQGGEPSAADAAAGDWRSQLQDDARQRIVNKIMDTLKRHLPISGPEGLNELQKIAVRFEEKIYTAATSQSDYLRKISLKILSMETKTQHAPPINPPMSNTTVPNQNLTDAVTFSVNNNLVTIEMLTGSNFKKWKRDVEFAIEMADIDLAMTTDKPADVTADTAW